MIQKNNFVEDKLLQAVSFPTQRSKTENLTGACCSSEGIKELLAKIELLETKLVQLHEFIVTQKQTKDWYSTAEVAAIVNKRPYTVREWCRLGRVHASKTMSGRGTEEEWRISHEELIRIQNDGLLPIPKRF